MKNDERIKQMNLPQILLYHLLPGVPILLLAIVFANPDWGFGFPSLLSVLLGAAIGLIPVQLLTIMLTAKRQGMKFRDAFPFIEKTSIGKLLLWAASCFILGILAFGLFSDVEYLLWQNFTLMPDWLRLDKYSMEDWGVGILRVTAVVNLVINGLLGSFTEEVYFRGFLLPRMNMLGKFAPLVNAALFSVYHLFSPWEVITRVLGCTPFAYAVWFKKDMRISMIVHCSMNLIGSIGMMITVFSL